MAKAQVLYASRQGSEFEFSWIKKFIFQLNNLAVVVLVDYDVIIAEEWVVVVDYDVRQAIKLSFFIIYLHNFTIQIIAYPLHSMFPL